MTRLPTLSGSWVGLAVVKTLVEAHGGRVYTQSPGEEASSAFTVELPMPGEVLDARRLLAGISVLVVDEDDRLRNAAREVLEKEGAEVTAVGSAADALAALERSKPRVLLSNLSSRGASGHNLVRTVLAHGATLPAVAVTTLTTEEDRRRALAAGIRIHLAKPLEAGSLVTAIAALTGRSVAQGSTGRRVRPGRDGTQAPGPTTEVLPPGTNRLASTTRVPGPRTNRLASTTRVPGPWTGSTCLDSAGAQAEDRSTCLDGAGTQAEDGSTCLDGAGAQAEDGSTCLDGAGTRAEDEIDLPRRRGCSGRGWDTTCLDGAGTSVEDGSTALPRTCADHAAGGSSGRSIVKTHPCPGTSRTRSTPPLASTPLRLMNSPRPRPLRFVPALLEGAEELLRLARRKPPAFVLDLDLDAGADRGRPERDVSPRAA